MARRAWSALSPAYRRRLERAGVTEADYARGAALAGARGHKPAEHRAPSRDQLARRHGFTSYREYKRAQDSERAAKGPLAPMSIVSRQTGRRVRVTRYEIDGGWTTDPLRVADLPRVTRAQLRLENGKQPIIRMRP